jgi:hypothetical protein
VDDLVDGIYTLMQSDLEGPVNLGSDERVTVADLVRTVIEVSGKRLKVKYVPGPVGVHARNFSKARIKSHWGGRRSTPSKKASRGHIPGLKNRCIQGSVGYDNRGLSDLTRWHQVVVLSNQRRSWQIALCRTSQTEHCKQGCGG